MAKGGLARERFQEKQQYNRIVSQLEKLYSAGYTADEIREAGNDAWFELGGPDLVKDPLTGQISSGTNQVVVADGDTVSSIASKNNTTPKNFLDANPELKNLRTGMVVTVPNGRKKDDTYTPGGLGIPSAGPVGAALGGLSTYRESEKSTGVYTPPKAPVNPYASNPFYKQGITNPVNTPGYSLPGATNAPAWARGINNAATQTVNPLASVPTAPQTTAFTPNFRTKDDYYPTQLAALIKMSSTRKATPTELAYLEKYGMIKKTVPQPAYSSYGGRGYSRGGGRGGGGGGSVAKTPTGTQQVQQGDRLPAFSSGSGFNGLVNWRL